MTAGSVLIEEEHEEDGHFALQKNRHSVCEDELCFLGQQEKYWPRARKGI